MGEEGSWGGEIEQVKTNEEVEEATEKEEEAVEDLGDLKDEAMEEATKDHEAGMEMLRAVAEKN